MSAGQGIGAVVGGIVGFMVAGPAGAFAGASLGMAAGGLLDPAKGPNVKGPRLDDLSIQVSTYGTDIPRIYGTIGGAGNVIQLENNKLKEKVRKKKSGGKGGGGSSETTTYSYSATFQLALCEGPIAGVRRIWCMDKLIYNAGSDDLETIIASNKAAKKWKLYLGTDDQMPDPRYEAEYGVGNVSAHRGLAYIAFYDFQLADYSNTLQAAQFKVEIANVATSTAPVLSRSVQLNDIEYPLFNGYSVTTYRTNGANSFISETHYPSNSVAGGPIFRPSEYLAAFVKRAVGFDSFFLGNDRDAFLVDGASYSTDVYGFGWTDFEAINGSDLIYVNARYISGVHLAVIIGASGTIELPSSNPQSIAAGDGVIYLVDLTSITTADAVDGSEISTVAIYPIKPLSANSVFASYYNGVVYVSAQGSTPGLFDLQGFDPITGDQVYNETPQCGNGLAGQGVPFIIEDGGLVVSHKLTNGGTFFSILETLTNSPVSLGAVIEAEVERSNLLTASDIDTSLISGSVRGYRVSGGSIRSSLEPLSTAFQFDARAHGYHLQFVPRGQASVATIPWEDLGAASGDSPDEILPQSREMDPQLPARTTVSYLDAAREYSISEQYSERLNTEAANRVERELAIVLTADEAAGIAEMLNNGPWIERTGLSFTLPPTYLHLEAADVVTIEAPNATYQVRITEPDYTQDGRIECKAVTNSAALYTPTATGAEGVPPAGTISLSGESLFIPLDIPVIDETLQDTVGFVGVMTGPLDGWPGGLTVRSNDGGQTWSDLQAYAGKSTISIARTALQASDGTLIDQRTLTVDMISGDLESVTRDQMLAGVNYAAYGVDARWEIVRFQNADLQADGSYLLSGFVRGEKGTEWATGLHAAGDYFILLDDPDNAFIGAPIESIGIGRLYRGVTSGEGLDDSVDVPFTYQGVNLECLSPVYAKGSRDGSSNFTGTFTRRSRLSSSWWATGVVAPVGEASESYEIDVMNGAVVVRTITAGTPSFAYSAADQSTDFGSAQASITFRIYQLSATVGRGYPLEVTL